MSNTLQGSRWAAVNDDGHVIGADHHSAKLSDADIDFIIAMRAAGLSYARIAAKFDDPAGPTVSKSMVHAVCTGHRRAQTVMGHKRVALSPSFTVAGVDEFELA